MNITTRLTDEELLARDFRVVDPEKLPLLTQSLPICDEVPEVEFAYDVTPPGGRKSDELRPMVWCVHCKEQNHWRGFVLRYYNGSRITVGGDCGQRIYGAEFTTALTRFEQEQERGDYLRLIEVIRAGLPGVLQDIAVLSAHPALEVFVRTRKGLSDIRKGLWLPLCAAIQRHGGALTVEDAVRDYLAEAARDEQVENREKMLAKMMTLTERKKQGLTKPKKRRPIYKYVQRTIGIVSGSVLADVTRDPAKEIADARANLQAAFKFFSGATPEMSTRQIVYQVKTVREATDAVFHAIQALGAPMDFCQPQNLALIAEWINHGKDRPTAKVDGTSLYWLRDDWEPWHVVSLPDSGLPDVSRLTAFRRHLGG